LQLMERYVLLVPYTPYWKIVFKFPA
jgi:hypothetical protein